MDYSIVYIIGVMFWVLLALAVVCLMIWAYTIIQYYHWDKEARQEQTIVSKVIKKIEEAKEEINYDEQYDNDVVEDSGGNYPE